MVEQLILPEMERLRAVAADEYSTVIRLWLADRHVRSARFDVDRFDSLLALADGRLQICLQGQNRRIVFNILRSFSQAELQIIAGGPDLDGQAIGQILIEATRAVVEYGEWETADRVEGQPIRLTDNERVALAGPTLETVARVIVLAAVRFLARISYRWAGKGMRLRLDQSGRPVVEDGTWTWEADPELRAAMDEYDARRQAASLATPTGLPVRRSQFEEESAFPWFAVSLCSAPVRVSYPQLKREHTTYGYMIRPVDIAERLAHLTDWDREFTAIFGMSVAALRRVCRALSNAIYSNIALNHVEFADLTDGIFPLTSGLTDAGLAPEYLHEVLAEGCLRAPKQVWIETLTAPRFEADEPPSADEVDAFIRAFTSNTGGPQRELQPRLFHELDKYTLLLDLILATEFIDLCYLAVVQGKDGRGKAFERYARRVIADRLDLAPPYPFTPGLKLGKLGREDDEIDFCFRWGNVLVNLDMKAKTRSLDIHRGVHPRVRNRVSDFADALLTRVEPRGRVLAELLRERGEPVDAVVSLLCTADVEYVPPDPRLRYAGVPRLLTAEEIADLVLDPHRWPRVVAAARSIS